MWCMQLQTCSQNIIAVIVEPYGPAFPRGGDLVSSWVPPPCLPSKLK